MRLVRIKRIYLLFVITSIFNSCSKSSDTEEITQDILNPSTPENLTATNITLTGASLSWDASTDNVAVAGYKIYQDGTEIQQATNTTYEITDLNPATSYTFEVSAVDSSNNESDRSNSVSITTESSTDTEVPSTPENLAATNTTVTGTSLSWDTSTDNEAVVGYKIYQDGTEIQQVTDTTYEVTNLNAETSYTFEISAIDSSNNESDKSNPLTITTEANSGSRAKVLVFTRTRGFNHNTKSESITMIENIASQQDFDVDTNDDGSTFDSLENLNTYDIIFFTNTSGNTLSESQRNNVEAYAAQGGNFISNHAASDSYGHSTASTVSGNGKGQWDWYAENVTGCSVRNNPNHTPAGYDATVTIQNQNTVLTASITFPWNDSEEWYYWEGGYLNNSFTELLRVEDTGSNSYDDPRMTAHYYNRPDGGTSFYTSMGHAKSKYSDEEFIQLIANAFKFILD
ncbi:ThuA domain-containing protein [Spongiivirga citrea]|uniref:Fibronectin type-III domain-containing protein n=1 Tax=Spongiivirga citrea TaxID=1481457 RepID=A0A6M0CH48_9FLAO|nr:ThuA domain-containing protein [Spongiivirga citrea]NER16283.1 hypothetical protein [Spongiivirga citrea]